MRVYAIMEALPKTVYINSIESQYFGKLIGSFSKKGLNFMTGQNALPNIPWQERPAGNSEIIWRYSANPIIPRDLIPSSNSIFNSAVVPFRG